MKKCCLPCFYRKVYDTSLVQMNPCRPQLPYNNWSVFI